MELLQSDLFASEFFRYNVAFVFINENLEFILLDVTSSVCPFVQTYALVMSITYSQSKAELSDIMWFRQLVVELGIQFLTWLLADGRTQEDYNQVPEQTFAVL